MDYPLYFCLLIFYTKLCLLSFQVSLHEVPICNYLGVPTKHTDDWCFTTDAEGCILTLRQGGSDCYHMFGISYMDQDTGKRLEDDIRIAFETAEGYRNRFWDDVALVLFADKYNIHIQPCSFDDVSN